MLVYFYYVRETLCTDGAPGRTRTDTGRILSPLSLPLDYGGQLGSGQSSAHAIPSKMSDSGATNSVAVVANITLDRTSDPAAITSTRPGCMYPSAAISSRDISENICAISKTLAAGIRDK